MDWRGGPSRRRNTPVRPRSRSGVLSAKNAQSTDAPEGVVDENKEEIRVHPFSCSGTLRDRTMRDLMRAQLGKRLRKRFG